MAFFSTTIKSTSSQQLCQLYFIFTAVISAVSFSWFPLVHELGPGSLFMQNITGPRTRHGLTSCSAYACCLVSFFVFFSFQEGTPDSIKLLSDPSEAIVDKLAADLGLQKVGWIFTDLVAEDVRKGTVKHLRDINTHFLTAEESILAGQLQNQHPSPCKLSSNGKFGSKFSTVVVSGMCQSPFSKLYLGQTE